MYTITITNKIKQSNITLFEPLKSLKFRGDFYKGEYLIFKPEKPNLNTHLWLHYLAPIFMQETRKNNRWVWAPTL